MNIFPHCFISSQRIIFSSFILDVSCVTYFTISVIAVSTILLLETTGIQTALGTTDNLIKLLKTKNEEDYHPSIIYDPYFPNDGKKQNHHFRIT